MAGKYLMVLAFISCMLFETAYADQYAFQITFTDKNNTPYSLSDPLVYLSARSLARRAAQGIALDSTDLPVNAVYVDSVLALTGGIFHETSRWMNMCMILLPAADSAEILHLAGKAFIKNVVQVGYYQYDLHARPAGTTPPQNSNGVKRATGADADYYGVAYTQTQVVNGNYLHDQGYNGEGKLIAVLDAGFIGTDTHPGFDSMWLQGQVVDTFDFTFHNTNVFYQDDHGTEVLSTIAANTPGASGFVGAAPKAMYALYVTEYDLVDIDEPLELDNMICGAERADSLGADVITESLGYDILEDPVHGQFYPENFDSLNGTTTVAARAANFATAKGILFVATAGNDGGADSTPGFGQHILTPGDADSALTIGAVDNSDAIIFFSGYGPNAAGVVKPDVCAMGAAAAVFNVPTGYAYLDGTSFSTPQVAGYAACLMEANPTATPAQVRQAIRECASLYPSYGPQFGYGVANFECAQITLGVKDTPHFTPGQWVMANPNPLVNNDLHLSVSPANNGNVNFRLTDMAGSQVFSFTQYMYIGFNAPLDLPVPELPPGIYILKAVSATQQQVIKVEKQ